MMCGIMYLEKWVATLYVEGKWAVDTKAKTGDGVLMTQGTTIKSTCKVPRSPLSLLH